jgi:hypothetical protein
MFILSITLGSLKRAPPCALGVCAQRKNTHARRDDFIIGVSELGEPVYFIADK